MNSAANSNPPLIARIADWASRIRQGDFSARLTADNNAPDELTDDINRLAEWLESLAESKNRELLEQGARLKTQTHIVRLLHDIAGDAAQQSVTADALLARTLRPMAEVLEARRIAFYRATDDDETLREVAVWNGDTDTDNNDNNNDNGNGNRNNDDNNNDNGNGNRNNDDNNNDNDNRNNDDNNGNGNRNNNNNNNNNNNDDNECITIPLRTGAKDECRLWFAAARFPLPDEFSQLLYTLGRNIGMALERIELREESARLSRLRERTLLANELHDSLAQTVAGLRFQVRVLDDLLHQQEEHAAWRQLENVEQMVEEANAEVRGLIGYFRAAETRCAPAIQAAVTRHQNDSDIPLFFQDQWGDADFAEQWQWEIVRIIQEALSNIRRHSQAKNARLLLRREVGDDGEIFTALVEDDGVGMSVGDDIGNQAGNLTGGEHIGLSVMRERAKSIGATLHIESEPGDGTRILLSLSKVTDGNRN